MDCWNDKKIADILRQLGERNNPFKGYIFEMEEGLPKLIGKGSYAWVFGAIKEKKKNLRFAIKVIGFGKGIISNSDFEKTVESQAKLAKKCKNIVRIFDHKSIRVQIDDGDHVVKCDDITLSQDVDTVDAGIMVLHFILMERLDLIIRSGGFSKPYIIRDGLTGDPKSGRKYTRLGCTQPEIYNFAHDISMAIKTAHDNGVLHRDIKLENVFYDPKRKRYKLGDFGISKITSDGMAGTIAYTKGYGAPEIVFSSGEKYDNTADIYSFGITLYLLLHQLKFPGSNGYYVNMRMQYRKNGVDATGGGAIIEYMTWLVDRMTAYDPKDRCQSIDDVIAAIEDPFCMFDLYDGTGDGDAPFLMGSIFIILGTALMHILGMHIQFLNAKIAVAVLAVLIIAVLLTRKSEIVRRSIMAPVCCLLTYLFLLFIEQRGFLDSISIAGTYSWIPCALYVLGAEMYGLYFLYATHNAKIRQILIDNHIYIKLCGGLYIIMIIAAKVSGAGLTIANDLVMVGVAGVVLTIYWLIRDRFDTMWRVFK